MGDTIRTDILIKKNLLFLLTIFNNFIVMYEVKYGRCVCQMHHGSVGSVHLLQNFQLHIHMSMSIFSVSGAFNSSTSGRSVCGLSVYMLLFK